MQLDNYKSLDEKDNDNSRWILAGLLMIYWQYLIIKTHTLLQYSGLMISSCVCVLFDVLVVVQSNTR